MKNLKCLMAIVLMLAMALSLAACGGSEAPAETKAPETEAPVVVTEAVEVETEAVEVETEAPVEEAPAYTVKVVDEAGNPIAGAMVQLCKDTCFPGVTDADGVAKFALAEDDYKVSFLALPAGYTYVDETQEFYFDNGSMELTITLKAA